MSIDWDDFFVGLWVVLGLAVIVAGIAVPMYFVGQHNRAKQEHLTTVCVEHGYSGWDDTVLGQPDRCVR